MRMLKNNNLRNTRDIEYCEKKKHIYTTKENTTNTTE